MFKLSAVSIDVIPLKAHRKQCSGTSTPPLDYTETVDPIVLEESGTAVIVDETKRWLENHPDTPVGIVRFTAFDRETAELFAAALRSLS